MAQGLGHLVEPQSDVVVQDEDRPLIDIEPGKTPLELVTIGEIEGSIRFGEFEEPDGDVQASQRPVLTRFAIARPHEHLMKPGIEPIGVAQAPDVPPGGDERLLGRILGLTLVAEDQPGDGVEPAGRDARQLTERVMVARHRSLHEIPIHRASGWCTTGVVVLQPRAERGGSGSESVE